MFQVKATVVAFLGNEELYPCHFQHKIGDEVIFDGESYHGRLCPDVWSRIAPKVEALHQAGPRYVEWFSYYPFWYCALNEPAPEMKKYDGLGFRNVLRTAVPPPYDMANLVNSEAFGWPPSDRDDINREPTVLCPDARTSMLVKLEAFDLSEKGYATPYFRRQMAILKKLAARGGVAPHAILDTFTKQEIEGIHPPLGTQMVRVLTEELQLMGYVETVDGVTSITPKGRAKLGDFRDRLPAEDLSAFDEYTD
ncbi:MAG: TIGR04076 family protein [Thermoleophilia bacterium]|nr:TIGR04076 family protein [Thermoleophilia bacterium]